MSDTSNSKGANAGPGPDSHAERVVYVMADPGMSSQADDEISFGDLWRIVWHGKWIVAAVTLIFAVGSVAYALMATEWYRSEALLAPAEARSTSPIAGQLSGLAALAGVSVGGPGNAEALAVLESRDFLRTFIEEHGILALLFEDQWDKERAAWRPEIGDEPPDVRDAIEYFRKSVLKVHQNRETQLVTIAVEWTDPDLAAKWVAIIVRRLNDRLRERALQEAETNVAYLQSEMAKTSLVTLQQSIGRILESELQKLMLARGNEEFAFKIVDPPEPPKKRVRPNRSMTAVLGTVLGGIIGVVLALLVHFWRVGRHQRHAESDRLRSEVT
jgi:uncharacterized protein involved in exopolysaccharide biosynthesis